ncbi:MAG TPA: tRNA (adenosine(37)-N6)-dimethylallyltransferase MiaA [Stellaceae bacterium]|jgi:tRNA dimethylallyltransferase|nr:tRNA (adenosine(37)-N6)-dimethylallyltransferase MiaA [Stellaceae bacterium]
MTTPIVIIGGPTASGKSALALHLAEALGGIIINADSMQVYRDLRVLTARPDDAALATVPHRLDGVLDAADLCSAARWAEMAHAEIAAARTQGHLPILVGGTGLYLRTLTQGIAVVPEIPAHIRQAARGLHAAIGGAGFHACLAEKDPEAARRLHPSDSQRMIRAYEVVTATGRGLGDWQRAAEAAPSPYAVHGIVMAPPRDLLYAAIDARMVAMVEAGALVEVERLVARNLAPDLPLMKAVGVPEFVRHLSGELDLDAAIALAQQSSRRYAKRQTTWFRHQMTPMHSVDAQFSYKIAAEICHKVRVALDGLDSDR